MVAVHLRADRRSPRDPDRRLADAADQQSAGARPRGPLRDARRMGARTRPRRCRHRPSCRRPGRNPADAPRPRRRHRRARLGPRQPAAGQMASGSSGPLLGWRKAELAALVANAGIKPVDDPSNRDPRHDRVRMREWLKRADWADPERLAASATWLNEADEALDWALAPLAEKRAHARRRRRWWSIRPKCRASFSAGCCSPPSPSWALPSPAGRISPGRSTRFARAETTTLAGLKLEGGPTWQLRPAPPRR